METTNHNLIAVLQQLSHDAIARQVELLVLVTRDAHQPDIAPNTTEMRDLTAQRRW